MTATLFTWHVRRVSSWKPCFQAVVATSGPRVRRVWSCVYDSDTMAQIAARSVCSRLNLGEALSCNS